MSLRVYEKKRDFKNTPEPGTVAANSRANIDKLRFVIQEHKARRLHYDFRLETEDGVLMSWAAPKGLSPNPKDKRLAIQTEDHPLSYINFEGTIPPGNYGAGSVIVWDTGFYEPIGGDIRRQQSSGKIQIVLHGRKVRGEYALVRMKGHGNGSKDQWLVVKKDDEYAEVDHLEPEQTRSRISDAATEEVGRSEGSRRASGSKTRISNAGLPLSVQPMMATAVGEPFDSSEWVFEVKWDGVRAILFYDKNSDTKRFQSRNLKDITFRYPELVASVDSSVSCKASAVLDGEIVVLDDRGAPDFQRHQSRMNLDSQRDIEFHSHQMPATYFVFDILYLDGVSLQELDFIQRRKILAGIIEPMSAGQGRIRISDYIEDEGKSLFQSAIGKGLEGLVAKRKQGKYIQGARSTAWLKIKGIQTQDCVVIGYTRGEGNREGLFGSLILAAFDTNLGRFRFVGHSGSGFGMDQLQRALETMSLLRTDSCPISGVPYVNRPAVWLRPELVAEIKFSGWTREGIMRAPIFLRFRDDKQPRECILESPAETKQVLQITDSDKERSANHALRENSTIGFSERNYTNLNKVFFPGASGADNPAGLTKKDLIEYYHRVAAHLLPHLRDRPLSLKRYPDGIYGKSFFHKNWTQGMAEFAESIAVYSDTRARVINYLLCNNEQTLLWLANLGCIEMHPWYSHVSDKSVCTNQANVKQSGAQIERIPVDESRCGLSNPDFIVFDLDPYIYSGEERQGEEPKYSKKAYLAAVDIAIDLKDLLDSLKIRSYVKTSGKTGLHIFIPIIRSYTFEQTRNFAQIIGKMLVSRNARGLTMQWNVSERKGKVFYDYNQNARGKTLASVLSVRPTEKATVSMPIEWKRLREILPTDFTIITAPEWLDNYGDPWREILDHRQDLYSVLSGISDSA